MADVKIILPDGSAKEYAAGTTLGEAVKQLSNSLAKKVLAANVNGELTDLREELVDGSEVAFLTFEEDGGKHTLRHTASHILAQAVKRLWPEAKLAIGPAIDKGFYYDIDMEHTLTPEDLGKIEKIYHKFFKIKEEYCMNCPISRLCDVCYVHFIKYDDIVFNKEFCQKRKKSYVRALEFIYSKLYENGKIFDLEDEVLK